MGASFEENPCLGVRVDRLLFEFVSKNKCSLLPAVSSE